MTVTATRRHRRHETHGLQPCNHAALRPTVSMIGTLDRCVLLSFRTPADSVQHLVPPGLELLRRGPFAFWNVVLCHVHRMRPAGLSDLPGVGVSYHHVAYRLMVRAMTERIDTRQGLYFVRSDADATLLGAVGNRLSDFRFHRGRVQWHEAHEQQHIEVTTADGRADAELTFRAAPPTRHPADSCFPTPADAAAALKYQPLGLAVNRHGQLKLAEVFRDESQWHEDPIDITAARLGFFDTLGQCDVHLERATAVAPLPYRWRLGRRERLLARPPAPRAEALPTPRAPEESAALPRPAVA